MKTIFLIVAQLVASGSDAYITNCNAHGPQFSERNPIARPFVRSQSSLAAYFAGGAAVKIAVPIMLRRRHHQRLADAIAIAGIADNAGAATFSATH